MTLTGPWATARIVGQRAFRHLQHPRRTEAEGRPFTGVGASWSAPSPAGPALAQIFPDRVRGGARESCRLCLRVKSAPPAPAGAGRWKTERSRLWRSRSQRRPDARPSPKWDRSRDAWGNAVVLVAGADTAKTPSPTPAADYHRHRRRIMV